MGRLIDNGFVPDTDPRYSSGWNFLAGKNLRPQPQEREPVATAADDPAPVASERGEGLKWARLSSAASRAISDGYLSALNARRPDVPRGTTILCAALGALGSAGREPTRRTATAAGASDKGSGEARMTSSEKPQQQASTEQQPEQSLKTRVFRISFSGRGKRAWDSYQEGLGHLADAEIRTTNFV